MRVGGRQVDLKVFHNSMVCGNRVPNPGTDPVDGARGAVVDPVVCAKLRLSQRSGRSCAAVAHLGLQPATLSAPVAALDSDAVRSRSAVAILVRCGVDENRPQEPQSRCGAIEHPGRPCHSNGATCLRNRLTFLSNNRRPRIGVHVVRRLDVHITTAILRSLLSKSVGITSPPPDCGCRSVDAAGC